ncbi:hypothetical protein N8I74_16700 [Chitiniphilus purpureus]|uniref:Polymerase nucleotidyl transferase domain-containing protein n=1 Tax=Chitiniphilus purpureus TaxID=2981137 RepID=A0ABY6DSS1_9NEIS|nr:hypothetical protein [Chitiniphilus sp. CD1]UXY14938.1 hypothetical protein N8I74_16700 [Chitiniphilus sp. CD1]
MDIHAYLEWHDTGLEALSCMLLDETGACGDDVLYVTGSLVEGLGNLRSDIDVYLVTGRTFEARADFASVLIIPFEACPVDVEIVAPERIEALIGRLARFAPDHDVDPRRAATAFSAAELKLLHNLRQGVPLFGAPRLADWQARIVPRTLSRILFDLSQVYLGMLHLDILGQIEDGDAASAIQLIEQYRGHLIGALLAALGNTNPADKWRLRLLERLTAGRHAPDLPPGHDLPGLARQLRGFRVSRPSVLVAFEAFIALQRLAHVIVPWGQRRFADPAAQHLTGSSVPVQPQPALPGGDGVLPALSIELSLRFCGPDAYRLTPLDEHCAIEVNQQAYAILLCFDGKTTLNQAAGRLAAHSGVAPAVLAGAIDDLQQVLRGHALL